MVADCVTKGNVVADVGCDHAYISIYLVEGKIAPKTIALDVNEGPLLRAQENIISYGMGNLITTRLSDGLHMLEPNEVDSIVIAGMGGPLMIKILEEGSECVKAAKELILQPQSEIWRVREYLHNLNFEITKEDMCIDEGKYYTVLYAQPQFLRGCVALPQSLGGGAAMSQSLGGCSALSQSIGGGAVLSHEKRDSATLPREEGSFREEREVTKETKELYNRYGRYLLENKHPILKQFLEKERTKAYQIKENLESNSTPKNRERYAELLKEIEMLEDALQYYRS